MNPIQPIVDRFRGIGTDTLPGLRAPSPPVALELDAREIVLVRLKRRGRGKPVLEAYKSREIPEGACDGSILHPRMGVGPELAARVRELFEMTGTKPGKVSLILPDSLAKISLLNLPDRLGSRKQLDEVVRFKLRRSVPFRLEEAMVSYQVLPSEGRGMSILVSLMRRAVVEQYEKILLDIGARPGLVDLSTPNVLNLCRPALSEAGSGGGDAAILNSAWGYFSLVILRGGRLIFFRCKTITKTDDEAAGNGQMFREVANSLAYYEEKLEGRGLETLLVRSVAGSIEETMEKAAGLGAGKVVPVDPTTSLGMLEGLRMDPVVAQRIAPAVGAAAGRLR
jgi:type IV pilus assembly protein PilM